MGPYPQHKNNFTVDTSSGVSGIWADCPFDEVASGYHPGYAKHWEFAEFKASANVNAAEAYWVDGLMVFGSDGCAVTLGSDPTVGTGTVANNAFGTVAIGSDGDNEGGAIRMSQAPFKLSGPNSTLTARSGKFWMEWRGKVSSIADTIADVYVGLMEDVACTASIPITATAGTLADKNLCGFYRLGTDGDYFDAVYKANGVPTSSTHYTAQADAQLLAADTYVKLGLTYDPADFRVRWFGNGMQLASYQITSAQGTIFPNDVAMCAVIAIINAAGSISPTVTTDWLRVCQIPLDPPGR